MTWRSITEEEYEICQKMRIWLETRKKWQPTENWLPSDPDISKSALFERLMNGKDPLPYPPPVGMSCPWYAIVEDPGPHYVGDHREFNEAHPAGSFGLYFRHVQGNSQSLIPVIQAEEGDTVNIWQSYYAIEEKISQTEFIVKDDYYDSPWRFRLWWDKDYDYSHRTISLNPLPNGAWIMRNIEFE